MEQLGAKSLKIITGADPFGAPLKDSLIAHLHSLSIPVQDLGTSSYYSIAADVAQLVKSNPDSRGLLVCGTGAGVAIFANKFPGIYANTCLTLDDAVNARSINNSNVLALSGLSTSPDDAAKILDTWLNTPFKFPCPANNNAPWSDEISAFLEESISQMPKIGEERSTSEDAAPLCALCCLAKNRELSPIEIMPGGSMKIVRESPTSAIVRFKAGSVEPAHHHSFGHDLIVLKGRKRVWNLSKEAKYDLVTGDYLFTPAGDVHRVKYFEDTEFFIKWEGKWDIFFDETLEVAKKTIEEDDDT